MDSRLSVDVEKYIKSAIFTSQHWKLPDNRGSATDSKAGTIKKAAVIGGGTMGRGIAISCVRAGFETILIENDEKALTLASKELEITYARETKLGRMSEKDVERLRKMRKSIDLNDLSDVDLVIEAIFENMKLKKELLKKLDKICKSSCCFASNTSSLDFDELSSPLSDRSRLVGMHFFNPPHVIKVIEIVYGSYTSKEAVATAFNATNAMQKIGILVANCPSFMFNRLLGVYLHQAMKLVYQHGIYPKDIDRIMMSFGLLMGPMTMHDMNGIDVSARIKSEHGMPLSSIEEELLKRKRFGRKTGKGYYKYDKNGLKTDDPEVKEIIDRLSIGQNKQQRFFSELDIVNFLLYPMVNEGFLCLEDGIIERVEHIDLMFHYGFGWPSRHGGPMRWGEKFEGLTKIRETMRNWHAAEPDEFTYRLCEKFEHQSKI
ncbi:unnamed protein product, partial [Mesorhabditis belari]|uniref:Uncharacterized protein n=1 Tax=Mesorhabditis belari TaxID=2138241 RepID=A0AAF3JBW7_9BILA